MSDPAIKTEPLRHQREVYLAHRDDIGYALFWEPGLGKTKELLDVASHLFLQGKITGLLIVAPNAVYRNWITQEMPKHLAVPYGGMAFKTSQSTKDEGKMKQLIMLDPTWDPRKLRVVCMSYDQVKLERAYEFAKKFLIIYKTMMAVDESSAIARHSTAQAKAVKKLGERAHYRWIADGTPMADGPFLIHSQIEFLYPEFWKNCGMKSFSAFKNEFGEYKTQYGPGGVQYPKLKSYRRLDQLTKLIQLVSSRLLKEDAGVELPPKVYTTMTFELTEKQQKIYNDTRDEYIAELDNGMILEAPLAIVRLTRLMQITSGFVMAETAPDWDADGDQLELPIEEADYSVEAIRIAQGGAFVDDAEIKPVAIERRVVDIIPPDENPRLQLLLYLINQRKWKIIVWCRFKREVDMICESLGDRALRYDGSTPQRNRMKILDDFRDPKHPAQVLVANTHAISQGVTLVIAKTMIYYTNSHSLRIRLQSEDRNHRIGQDVSVEVIDLAAEGTVDLAVIDRLRSKFDIAAAVSGDKLREWITK